MAKPLTHTAGRYPTLQEAHSLHQTVRRDLAGYDRLAARLNSLIGVDMPASEKNRTLMACRLAPLLRRHGCENYSQYEMILMTGDPEATREFISSLTTHTTDFYREGQHFSLLPTVVRQLEQDKQTRGRPELRVWCAAASTGQEPYTLLFTLLESGVRAAPWSLKFLASDIDRGALLRAANGTYTADQTAKIPDPVRARYFEPPEIDGTLTVRGNYKRLITFAEFNLAASKYPFQYPFDIIFCRNVLIYFSHDSGKVVVDRLVEALAPGGFLFLGHSETGFVKNRKLRVVAPAVFQKV
jgi:chemotaxis protein methyltransferase CheR